MLFNKSEKIIELQNTDLDTSAINMYKSWKDWHRTDQGILSEFAFRVFGGDPTIAGQYAPFYVILINYWRIVIDGLNVKLSGNLYADHEDYLILKNNASVELLRSDASIISSGADASSSSSGTVEAKLIDSDFKKIAQEVWSFDGFTNEL